MLFVLAKFTTENEPRLLHLKRHLSCIIGLLVGVLVSGCAVHYYDPATQTEHVWGFGHIRFKAATAQEDVKAVLRGVRTIGVSIAQTDDGGYAVLGYHDIRSIKIMPEDAELRLEWPTSRFIDVRIGRFFPIRFLEQVHEENHERR